MMGSAENICWTFFAVRLKACKVFSAESILTLQVSLSLQIFIKLQAAVDLFNILVHNCSLLQVIAGRKSTQVHIKHGTKDIVFHFMLRLENGSGSVETNEITRQ